jgi:YVTN family beta-propeller protein
VQSLSLLSPSGRPAPRNTPYRLSAWLGGMVNSWAEVTVRFSSATNRVLASRTIGPVGRTRRAEFAPRAGSGVLPAGTATAQITVQLAASASQAGKATPKPVAWVANYMSGTVTPVNLSTRKAGKAIAVGVGPAAIAVTPNGRTAYVLGWAGGTVTPIDTATDTAQRPIQVGSFPSAIGISPRGGTAYVANYGSGTVTPITLATETAGRAIAAGDAPNSLAVAPNGKEVYVVDGNTDEVTPIATATGRPGRHRFHRRGPGHLRWPGLADQHQDTARLRAGNGGELPRGRGDFPLSQGPPAGYFHTLRKPA